ncbi:MAG: right-handed parallel beta-helix repeat-containing protein [Thermoleophilaceae bacterium]
MISAVVTGALVLVPSAAAKTRTVSPGHSIQAAIDKSKPGDTVFVEKGKYKESLDIGTNDVTLEGERGTIVKGGAGPGKSLCNQDPEQPGAFVGICVHGQIAQPAGGPPDVVKEVEGVVVRHLTVQGFGGDGVFVFGGRKSIVRAVHLLGNGGYGAFSNTSRGTHFINNDVQDNGAPGLYVGDSPNANATIRGNYVKNNHGEGILLRNASHGHIRKNILKDNCAGLLVLADAPGPARKWSIVQNAASQNNKACAGDPGEGEPAISGIGIGLMGAKDTTLFNNALYRNRDKHPSIAHGGIVVTAGVAGTPEHNLLIKANALTENSPFDISWDKKGDLISFIDNQCATSKPSSICSG